MTAVSTGRLVPAWSCAPRALELLGGVATPARTREHGYVEVDGEVLWVSPSAAARSPLSIQVDVTLPPGLEGSCGAHRLELGGLAILEGPAFDPRPVLRVVPVATPALEVDPDALVGHGPGLTPLGDDVWCGVAAGAALLGADAGLRLPAPARTTVLSRSLMARALLGELAQPAHELLTFGDPAPLREWGATSGLGVLLGLAAAVARHVDGAELGEVQAVTRAAIDLPALRWRGEVALHAWHPGGSA